ncbi:MAG: peptidoglycan recognition protein family protein, partial [Elusimicrobiota bacterium]|nr:peptidoglycan recognition protein family protein [Elusimicrobiota bacterium]
HKEHNGWADIGYHFIIEKIGGEYKTLEGRNLEQTGAHALGFNSTHIGICCVGNFDKDTPSEKLYATTRALIDTLQEKYNIKSKDIIGHRDTYVLLGKPIEKTCPGKNFEIAKILS